MDTQAQEAVEYAGETDDGAWGEGTWAQQAVIDTVNAAYTEALGVVGVEMDITTSSAPLPTLLALYVEDASGKWFSGMLTDAEALRDSVRHAAEILAHVAEALDGLVPDPDADPQPDVPG